MTPQELLLKEIRSRQEKSTEFNRGILTADRYIKTLAQCVGSDLCYRYAAKGSISFEDVLTKAASTLTYNNEEMTLENIYGEKVAQYDKDLNPIELPKNTLMVFRHTLTTSRKDRDGDYLQTKGAKPDPSMLLLWQHTHTLPIGKVLGTAEHTAHKLSMISAIVDVNELAHDSAVMIENKMGRFSHGFKALDFEKNKDTDGKESGGFNIKSFEIMEASLVSVPANVDAEVEDVILSLVSNGKLTSPMMKSYGTSLDNNRSRKQFALGGLPGVPVKIDLQLSVNGKAVETETKEEPNDQRDTKGTGTKCNGKPGCGCGCTGSGAPKKADDHNHDHHEDDAAKDKEGLVADEKAGRVISGKNITSLTTAKGHIQEIHDKEHLLTRGGKAMCKDAMGLIDGVLESAKLPEQVSTDVTVKEAEAIIIAKASFAERKNMIAVLSTLNEIDTKADRTAKFLALTGRTAP
jgi:HK97 family phage prohead protease